MTITKPIIIGLSGFIGCGKTTAAMYLVENHGFKRVRFAGPLKAMMAALGLSQEEIDGNLKEQPCDLLGGKTPRWAMQSIGTEWGRHMMDENIWVNAWRRACGDYPLIVTDDVRFPNEAEAIKAAGGMLVRVVRHEQKDRLVHASEKQDFRCDTTIHNLTSISELHQRLAILVAQTKRDLSWAA
jgi:hypothetical protein